MRMQKSVCSNGQKLIMSEFYPDFYEQMERSSNNSLTVTNTSCIQDDQSDGLSSYYAVYQPAYKTQKTYYGTTAAFDIYDHANLVKDQITSGIIWVVNKQENYDNIEAIHVGWHVYPSRYNDTKTHFFVYWTPDGYKTGCYNTDCPGFELIQNAQLVPGSVLPTSTAQQRHTLTIEIYKDSDAWNLYAGVDSPANKIGQWHNSLFKNLQDVATDISFGGYTESPNKILSPPMGSGYLPDSIAAASVKYIQYIDEKGRPYDITWELPSHVSDPRCYSIGSFENRQFTYGGPGGCTN
ncbi:hypothetical protein LUZ60_001194 [Juncus effusus]|nr:hypothetical protein LUZ60_001194 [Juncus effusus]